MKKTDLKTLLAILLMAVISTTLFSCKDDDPIIGTWIYHYENNNSDVSYDEIVCFKSNGTGYERVIMYSSSLDAKEEAQFDFTYKINGNEVTVFFDDKTITRMFIISDDGKKLTLYNLDDGGDSATTYTKK